MPRSNPRVVLVLAASTMLSGWALAQNPKPDAGKPAATQPAKNPMPKFGPEVENPLEHETPATAKLPKENHALHVALHHLDYASEVLAEAADQGGEVTRAREQVDAAADHVRKALGDKAAKKPAAKKPGEKSALERQSAEDAAFPVPNHRLYVGLRHVTIARNALKATKEGGEHRNAARTQANLVINQLYKALDLESPITKDDDKD